MQSFRTKQKKKKKEDIDSQYSQFALSPCHINGIISI